MGKLDITVRECENGYIVTAIDVEEEWTYEYIYSSPNAVVAAVARLLKCTPEELRDVHENSEM